MEWSGDSSYFTHPPLYHLCPSLYNEKYNHHSNIVELNKDSEPCDKSNKDNEPKKPNKNSEPKKPNINYFNLQALDPKATPFIPRSSSANDIISNDDDETQSCDSDKISESSFNNIRSSAPTVLYSHHSQPSHPQYRNSSPPNQYVPNLFVPPDIHHNVQNRQHTPSSPNYHTQHHPRHNQYYHTQAHHQDQPRFRPQSQSQHQPQPSQLKNGQFKNKSPSPPENKSPSPPENKSPSPPENKSPSPHENKLSSPPESDSYTNNSDGYNDKVYDLAEGYDKKSRTKRGGRKHRYK